MLQSRAVISVHEVHLKKFEADQCANGFLLFTQKTEGSPYLKKNARLWKLYMWAQVFNDVTM